MPDEILLTTLQTLRDEYSQKEKTANGLIKALRGKASAFGKVQQALGDYTQNNVNADPLPGQQLQDVFGTAGENVNSLVNRAVREAKDLVKLTGALKGIINALSSDPIDVVRLSHPYEALKALEVPDERLSATLPVIEHELEAAQEALGVVFGAALHDALVAEGLEVGGTTPKFEVGRFEISANFITRSASISYGKEVVIKRVPLSVERVVKAYQNAVKTVTRRNEHPETWLAQFYNAYESARRKKDASNPRANVVDCYFELMLLRQVRTFFSAPTRSGFAEYTRAQFAYDLQEIAIRSHLSHKGKVVFAHGAIKAQSDSATKSLWVVEGNGPHDGRYVGDIVFDKDE